MIRFQSPTRRPHGFSLLEIMIAVVVLSTGLLALAALQGSLTKSSAEAKVRGRVVAMLSARMDELRSGGYGTLTDGTTTTSAIDGCDGDATDWLDCTRVQAGLGALSVSQTVASWSGATVFTQTPATDPDQAQFRRVTLTASWADAGAGGHQMSVVSDISPLGLTASLIPPPEDQTSGGGGPLVRTSPDEAAGVGVIPIALGNGDSSAASNPTPELVGQNNNQSIVGTRFNVLTYTASGSSAVIQNRIENEIIKCSCQYGAGGTNLRAIYRTAQWPAIWTGARYDLYKPNPAADAPGQALSAGPKAGVNQSALCQECCRDHHDTTASGVAKFDPERSDGLTSKYNLNAGALVLATNTTNASYVNACRMIRVDGFWRTAADMYSRQFGLLETETLVVSGDTKKAKTGLPTTAATTAYTSFVKNYLKQYDGSVATAPTNAQSMFDATAGINEPPLVPIVTTSNTDYRYLHGRGLYVDYLEAKARTKLVGVLADNGPQGRCPTGSNLEDCILPYLPFTSANLTEIAKWVASNTSVLTVNSGNLLATNPGQPSGGRTIGTAVGTSDNTASARKSNSGVAINSDTAFANLNGVDPTDNTAVGSDAQPFQVGGTTSTGGVFYVGITGGGLNPFAFYTIGATDTAECVKPATGDRKCATNSTLPAGGYITLSNYWSEITVPVAAGTVLGSIQCTYNGGPVPIETNGQNRDIDVPAFRNYYVSAVSGIAATGSPPYTVANDGKKTETTQVAFGTIPAGGVTATVTFTEAQTGSPIVATLVSCTATKTGNNYFFGTGTWSKPWELP